METQVLRCEFGAQRRFWVPGDWLRLGEAMWPWEPKQVRAKTTGNTERVGQTQDQILIPQGQTSLTQGSRECVRTFSELLSGFRKGERQPTSHTDTTESWTPHHTHTHTSLGFLQLLLTFRLLTPSGSRITSWHKVGTPFNTFSLVNMVSTASWADQASFS